MPGEVSLPFVTCRDCPANVDGRGHHVFRCRVIGCDAPVIVPPGHVGPLDAQH
jgi:hypothetical protein